MSTVPWPVSMMTGWSTPWLIKVQHCQSADAGHAHIEHDGAYGLAVKALHEGLRIGPRLHAQAHRANQQRQRIAHGFVVIDQMN